MALTKDQFAEQLRHHRALAGLTQTELAERVGVNLRTFQRWEDAERTPYKRHLLSLARALNVDPQVFTGTLATADTLIRIEQALAENNRLLRQLYAQATANDNRLTQLEAAVGASADGISLQDHLAQLARETSAEAALSHRRAAAKRS